jgi:hypothetical protein
VACRPAGLVCPSDRCCQREAGSCETPVVSVQHHHGIEVYEPGGIVRFQWQPSWAAVHRGGGALCRITEAQARALIEQLTPGAEARRG